MLKSRFSLTPEQLSFYAAHQYICFENLLSADETASLAEKGDSILAERLKMSPDKTSPTALFLQGRNLWRSDSLFKKIVLNSSLAHLAGQLFRHRSLRLAYDHYLCAAPPFEEPLSLAQISSLQGMVGGVLLKLEGKSDASLLPSDPGSALFFAGNFPFPFKQLCTAHKLLLIAYCTTNTLYTPQPQDPLLHSLKKEGYAFGDALQNPGHPLVLLH